MRTIKRNATLCLLFVICSFFFKTAQATHIMGLDLTYVCLGENTYEFTLKFYRDCAGAVSVPHLEGGHDFNLVARAECNRCDTIIEAVLDTLPNTPGCSVDSSISPCPDLQIDNVRHGQVSGEFDIINATHVIFNNDNGLVMVMISHNGNVDETSVTYAGKPMILLSEIQAPGPITSGIWYLTNPPTDTSAIVVNTDRNEVIIGMISFVNVDTLNPFGQIVRATGNNDTASAYVPSDTRDIIVSMLSSRDTSFSGAGTGQTLRWNRTASIVKGGAGSTQKGGLSAKTEWNLNKPGNYALMAIPVRPACKVTYSGNCFDTTSIDTLVMNCGPRNYSQIIQFSKVGVETLGVDITPVCAADTTSCNGGNTPGVEEWIYKATVHLDAHCSDWKFSFQDYTRSSNITNLILPDDDTAYVETTLDNMSVFCNNAPAFTNPPIAYICQDENFCYNMGALDPDGDSLSYELYIPKTGPDPEDTVTYDTGFSYIHPLSGTDVSLDPKTGDFCLTPSAIEISVLAVRVNEWRDGKKIGSVERDLQVVVLDCGGNSGPSISGIDSTGNFGNEICVGDTFRFNIFTSDGNGTDSSYITWNNAIPGATFTVDTTLKNQKATFVWVPTDDDARTTPYTFTVSVRDNACPLNSIQTKSFSLYARCCFPSNISQINVSCGAPNNGSATINPQAGTPPFKYKWSTDDTSKTITGLTTGTYYVTATDAEDCISRDTVNIISDGTLTVSSSISDVKCKGSNSGAIELTVSEGRPPYSFNWLPNSSDTTEDVSNLVAGTYNVTILDENLCGEYLTLEVEEPSDDSGSLSFTVTTTPVKCLGDSNNGTATVHPTGGWGNYRFEWNTGDTTQTITGLTAGAYFVTVTDSGGCSLTNLEDGGDSIIIDSLPLGADPLTFYITETPVKCKDDTNTGTATAHPSGGWGDYTYKWSNGDTSKTISGLSEGVYYVTVIDAEGGGCVLTSEDVSDSAVIEKLPVDSLPLTFYVTETPVKCKDDSSTGTATAHPSGGWGDYTYKWSNGDTSKTISGLSEGVYYVTVIDAEGGGCILTSEDVSDSAVIKKLPVDSLPLTFYVTETPVKCKDDVNTGTATAHPSGGWGDYTYKWSNGDTTQTITGLSEGVYYVTVIDAEGGGCVLTSEDVSDSAVIEKLPPGTEPLSFTQSKTDATCGFSDGIATAHARGGWGDYTYIWNNGQTDSTITGLAPGNYCVTIIDAGGNGCKIDNNGNNCVAVLNLSDMEIDPGYTQTITCKNESITLGGSPLVTSGGAPPFTYKWSEGSTIANLVVNPATRTVYYISVTDSNNCTQVDSAIVDVYPDIPAITVSPEEVLVGRGAKVPLAVTGNYDFSWSPAEGLDCTDCQFPVASPSRSTVYTVVATDPNGCSATDSVLIRISGKIEIYVPNTFTPNGDNLNDKIKVEGFGIKRIIAFRIFDRWGQKVFETTDQDDGWDGTFKGKPLDMDRYVYYVIIETFSGEQVTRQGGITLVR